MDSISKKWAILVCSLICVNRALSAGRHSIHLENKQNLERWWSSPSRMWFMAEQCKLGNTLSVQFEHDLYSAFQGRHGLLLSDRPHSDIDQIHPTDAGYHVIAMEFKKAIQGKQ
jgi:hypothetical protein